MGGRGWTSGRPAHRCPGHWTQLHSAGLSLTQPGGGVRCAGAAEHPGRGRRGLRGSVRRPQGPTAGAGGNTNVLCSFLEPEAGPRSLPRLWGGPPCLSSFWVAGHLWLPGWRPQHCNPFPSSRVAFMGHVLKTVVTGVGAHLAQAGRRPHLTTSEGHRSEGGHICSGATSQSRCPLSPRGHSLPCSRTEFPEC